MLNFVLDTLLLFCFFNTDLYCCHCLMTKPRTNQKAKSYAYLWQQYDFQWRWTRWLIDCTCVNTAHQRPWVPSPAQPQAAQQLGPLLPPQKSCSAWSTYMEEPPTLLNMLQCLLQAPPRQKRWSDPRYQQLAQVRSGPTSYKDGLTTRLPHTSQVRTLSTSSLSAVTRCSGRTSQEPWRPRLQWWVNHPEEHKDSRRPPRERHGGASTAATDAPRSRRASAGIFRPPPRTSRRMQLHSRLYVYSPGGLQWHHGQGCPYPRACRWGDTTRHPRWIKAGHVTGGGTNVRGSQRKWQTICWPTPWRQHHSNSGRHQFISPPGERPSARQAKRCAHNNSAMWSLRQARPWTEQTGTPQEVHSLWPHMH